MGGVCDRMGGVCVFSGEVIDTSITSCWWVGVACLSVGVAIPLGFDCVAVVAMAAVEVSCRVCFALFLGLTPTEV